MALLKGMTKELIFYYYCMRIMRAESTSTCTVHEELPCENLSSSI